MGANASSQMIPINSSSSSSSSSSKNGMMKGININRKRMARRPAIASSSSSSLPSLMEESSTSSCSTLAHDEDEVHRIESIQERLQHLHDVEQTKYNKAVKAPFPVWKKNTQWRRQMIDWMISLLEYCDLPYPVAAAATYYLDVAVSSSHVTKTIDSSSDYQCTATAALFLALKTYDAPNLRCMDVDSLVHLGDGRFDSKDVLQRERDLLECLEWNLFPPTPFCYLHEYLSLLSVLQQQQEDNNSMFLDWLQEEAHGRMVSSVSQPSLMHVPSHALAQAALLSTLEDACCHVLSSSSSKQDKDNSNFAESIRQVLYQLEEYAQFQMDDPQLVQVLTSLVDPKSTTTKPFGSQEALLLENDNDDSEGSHWRKTFKSGTTSCFSNPVSPTHVVVE